MQGLTYREREVLNCLARALNTKEIAASLGISEHTVSQHRKNICRKLGLHSTAHLIAYAVQAQAQESITADARTRTLQRQKRRRL